MPGQAPPGLAPEHHRLDAARVRSANPALQTVPRRPSIADRACRPTPAQPTPPNAPHAHRPAIPSASEAPARRRDRPPRQRTEEPDHVILGAVTLPVAGDNLLTPVRPARLRRCVLGNIDHSVDQRRRVLPRHGLAEPGLPRDRAQPLARIPAPNASKPDPGKPALRTANSRCNGQPPTNGAYSSLTGRSHGPKHQHPAYGCLQHRPPGDPSER
jgi:hypothetical protein